MLDRLSVQHFFRAGNREVAMIKTLPAINAGPWPARYGQFVRGVRLSHRRVGPRARPVDRTVDLSRRRR